jgi:uncharacterized protein (DUF924 family)
MAQKNAAQRNQIAMSCMSTSAEHEAVAGPKDIVAFWLGAGLERWFKKDDAFDAEIRGRFLATYRAAAAGKLAAWADTPDGALALLLVLDQFPRNMFRGSAQSFATDPMALGLAKAAVARGFDQVLQMPLRQFFYLPLMHSEDLGDQERCVALYRALDDTNLLKWADLHLDVIRRFGRFPHRNALLVRTTRPDEQAFLDAGGFAG